MRSTTVSLLLDLNRQFYQQFGAAFSATRQRIQPGVARLLERLPLSGRWLDLGCGNGELARELGRRGFEGEYVGLDFSEELLEEARKGFAGPHPPAPSPRGGEGEEGLANGGLGPRKAQIYTPKISPALWEKLRNVAREMRLEPTEAESLLWKSLRGRKELNLKFRRQHSIGQFIVDFYCPEISLVIEVDGSVHQFTREEDAIRQEFLESQGLKVIRFQNDQILYNLNQVLHDISVKAQELRKAILHNVPNTPPPLHPVERGPGGEVLPPRPGSSPFLPEFHLVDLSSSSWSSPFPSASFDAILCFAALHHLPGLQLRQEVLAQARRLLAPGGRFVHSEWQFRHSAKLRARQQPWEKIGLDAAELEEGDALLDWRYALPGQAEAEGLRYVHHFSREELAGLAEGCGFRVLETFESDGSGGRLGLYQVWEAA